MQCSPILNQPIYSSGVSVSPCIRAVNCSQRQGLSHPPLSASLLSVIDSWFQTRPAFVSRNASHKCRSSVSQEDTTYILHQPLRNRPLQPIKGQRLPIKNVQTLNGRKRPREETDTGSETIELQTLKAQILQSSEAEISRTRLIELNSSLSFIAPECSVNELIGLLITVSQVQRQPLSKGINAVLDAVLQKDPHLETVNLLLILKICAQLQVHHDDFLNEAAKCVANRLPIIKVEEALTWLDTLAALSFQMQESTRKSLEKAVDVLLTSSQQEITAKTRDVTMIARALRRLNLQPPRNWLMRMMEVLTTRIELQVMAAEGRAGIEGQVVEEVASCILCLGHLQHPIPHPQRLFEAITYACGSADEEDLVSIARGIQRLDRIVKVPRYAWNALDRCAAERLYTLTDQDMCRVLHAFAKCRVRPRRLLPKITAQVVERSFGFTLHQVSILLWSFAMLSRSTPVSDGATSALVSQAKPLLLNHQYMEGRQHTVDLANIAWAVVLLGHNEPHISEFVELVMKSCRPIQAMSGISMAIMLWACAKSGAEPYQLSLYTARVIEVVKELDSFQITTILWAYGRLNFHPGIELMEYLLTALTVKISTTDTQGIGDAIWACGVLGHHPGPLVNAVTSDLQKRGAEYIMSAWSAIIWGLTQVGEDTSEVLKLAHHMIDEKRIKYDARLIATILWSAAVFEHFQTPVYKRMMGLLHVFPNAAIDSTSSKHVREAHLLAALAGELEGYDVTPAFSMDGKLQQWKAELMHQDLGRQSLNQLASVRETLRKLQIPYIAQYPIVPPESGHNGKGLLQNVMIDRPWGRNRRVAVEFLSPNMMTVNTHQPRWRSRFRAACLCALGYDVLWLPYSEWDTATAKNRQEEFLYSRIQRLLGSSS